MKLSKHIEQLEEILKDNGDLDVVYSIDEEGNSFNEVCFTPSFGHYDKQYREYNSYDELDQLKEELIDDGEEVDEKDFIVNAVCIN